MNRSRVVSVLGVVGAVAGSLVVVLSAGGSSSAEARSASDALPAATNASVTVQAISTTAACKKVAATFRTKGSKNPSLPDPKVSATCSGKNVVVRSNGIPDFTYIETSPGSPTANTLTTRFPAKPTVAKTITAVPRLGAIAIAIDGIPIFGPTEGQGGDVLATPGLLSECGGHNGPTGYHFHLLGTSKTTDCLYSPAQVASGRKLFGYAFDGYPIYSGDGRARSSWKLTNESLFATNTWAAHTYVKGSGNLDRCNGRTDRAGNYAYYTTTTFPYVLGCYRGVVTKQAAGGSGGPPTGGPPPPPQG